MTGVQTCALPIWFLNAELDRVGLKSVKIAAQCTVVDTLVLAKNQYPGKRNSLDGLCDRFAVNRSNRNLHGALLDARLLAEVYLNLTRNQESLGMALQQASMPTLTVSVGHAPLAAFEPSTDDWAAHEAHLDGLEKDKKGASLWRAAQ